MAAVLALAAFLVALSPLQAPTPRQWMTLRVPESGFAADFPIAPRKQTTSTGGPQWIAELDSGFSAYMITVSDITVERLNSAGAERVLEDAVDGGLKRYPGARVLSRVPMKIGGNSGREFVAVINHEGTLYRIANRVILVHTRLYVVTAIMKEGAIDQAEMDRFLRSVALIAG